MKTKGNIKILWYQHKTQGGNSIIWLKNKLPSVDIPATIQHVKRIVQFELDAWSKLVIFIIFLNWAMKFILIWEATDAFQQWLLSFLNQILEKTNSVRRSPVPWAYSFFYNNPVLIDDVALRYTGSLVNSFDSPPGIDQSRESQLVLFHEWSHNLGPLGVNADRKNFKID